MKSLLCPSSGYRFGWACGAVLAVSLFVPQVVRGEEVTKSFTVAGRPNVRVETNDGAVQTFTSDFAGAFIVSNRHFLAAKIFSWFQAEKRSWVDFSFASFSEVDREKRHI